MFGRSLSIVCAVIAAYFLYSGFQGDRSKVEYAVPFIVLAVIFYIFANQINWVFQKNKAPKLAKPLMKLLRARNRFYQLLSDNDKKKFEERVSLFIIAHDFTPMGLERLPEDVKMMIASRVVMLTFKSEDFLYDDFEKVIIYKDAFLSPDYRDDFHASEMYLKDKCTLFSMKHIFASYMEDFKYYDIVLHEFSKVWRLKNIDLKLKYKDENIWEILDAHHKYTKTKVSKAIGLEQTDPFPVLVNLYFYDEDFLKENLPEIYVVLKEKFN